MQKAKTLKGRTHNAARDVRRGYPLDWPVRSWFVRVVRARNRCEWCGARNHQPHPATGSRVVLTTAHVYDRAPAAASLLNLAALCQRCHLNHDRTAPPPQPAHQQRPGQWAAQSLRRPLHRVAPETTRSRVMPSSQSTSRGPGLRSAAPSPSLRAACPPVPVGLAFGRCLIPGGAQVGGPDAGKAPRTVLDAFLPGLSQRSTQHPKSRVHSASLRSAAALDFGASVRAEPGAPILSGRRTVWKRN